MSANRRRRVSSSLLLVGHYTITTQKQGFEPFTLSDVVVNVNENLRVDLSLSLGRCRNPFPSIPVW
jgi:hypothetical protein